MKFAIFREIKKGKRKFLLEMDADEIKKAIRDKVAENVGENGAMGFEYAWEDVIKEFKKKTIRIP